MLLYNEPPIRSVFSTTQTFGQANVRRRSKVLIVCNFLSHKLVKAVVSHSRPQRTYLMGMTRNNKGSGESYDTALSDWFSDETMKIDFDWSIRYARKIVGPEFY